jgi:hypothetical protein
MIRRPCCRRSSIRTHRRRCSTRGGTGAHLLCGPVRLLVVVHRLGPVSFYSRARLWHELTSTNSTPCRESPEPRVPAPINHTLDSPESGRLSVRSLGLTCPIAAARSNVIRPAIRFVPASPARALRPPLDRLVAGPKSEANESVPVRRVLSPYIRFSASAASTDSIRPARAQTAILHWQCTVPGCFFWLVAVGVLFRCGDLQHVRDYFVELRMLRLLWTVLISLACSHGITPELGHQRFEQCCLPVTSDRYSLPRSHFTTDRQWRLTSVPPLRHGTSSNSQCGCFCCGDELRWDSQRSIEAELRVVVVVNRHRHALLGRPTTWLPWESLTTLASGLIRKPDAGAYTKEPYEPPDAPSLPDQPEVDEHLAIVATSECPIEYERAMQFTIAPLHRESSLPLTNCSFLRRASESWAIGRDLLNRLHNPIEQDICRVGEVHMNCY